MSTKSREHERGGDGEAQWFRSSYTTPNNNCVEVRIVESGVHVRDSKDAARKTLQFDGNAWKAFLTHLMR
ncbi:DUF397 domain-containing protein [Amycolatopsis sp. NPDC089917]|uniref:DUF397 domain-containing protein n=1 Tax=Amycolatopsis sp. NPDC089917 TaxID=3155187 RepID=UPI003433099F